MAIIRFGVSVVGARGTAGGLTFSANKAGPYFKTWAKSSNPRAVRQTAQRNSLADFASNWANLTIAQQLDWDDYADDPAQELTNSLGLDYFISGFNWYVRINLHLEAAGAAQRVDAPTLVRPGPPVMQTRALQRFFTTGSTTPSAASFVAGSPEIAKLHAVFGRITSQGRTSITSNFAFLRIAIPNASSRVSISNELVTHFGTVLPDTRLHYFCLVQDDHGQRGPSDTEFKDVETD